MKSFINPPNCALLRQIKIINSEKFLDKKRGEQYLIAHFLVSALFNLREKVFFLKNLKTKQNDLILFQNIGRFQKNF